jgi:enediyne biosynthesis protein E4
MRSKALHVLSCLAALVAASCVPGRREAGRSSAALPSTAVGAVGATTRIAFQDVAEASGIRFVQGHGGRSPLNIRETAGRGCALLDADGDGLLDLRLVGQPRCALYRNQGGQPGEAPRYEEITAAAGLDLEGDWMGCAAGDYDNDGRVDLLLTGYRCAALFHNEGARFRDVSANLPLARDAWNTSAVFFDADGDGRLDLYVGAYVRFDRHTLQLCDFAGVKAACPPTYYDPERGRLYHNLGNGRFADVTREAGLEASHGKTLGVAAADFDGDGRTDLYLANDGMPGDLFHNEALGSRLSALGESKPVPSRAPSAERRALFFRNVGVESGTAFNAASREQAGMGVDWGDYDGDGRLDLVVTTFQYEPTSLYHNEGHGAFVEEAYPAGIGDATLARLGFGTKFFDADNDGDLDLIQANGHVQDNAGRIFAGVTYPQSTLLFENLGDRRWGGNPGADLPLAFREVSAAAGAALTQPIVGRGLAVGDVDNDGDQDVLIANLEGAPLLLLNQTPRSGHSLTVRLVGTTSPRDGTGARVTVRAGGRVQVREAGTGGSYLSAGDPRVHFGLGAAGVVDSITVRWPTGRVQTLHHVLADRELTLREAGAGG